MEKRNQHKTYTNRAVGVLTLNENDQIIFEPNTTVNYLTESFGLTSVASESIKRNIAKVKPLIPS